MEFRSCMDDESSVEAAAASNGRNAPPGFPQRRNQMSPREKCYTAKQKTSPTAAPTKKRERRTKSEKRRASDENYARMKMNLIAFGEKIEELKTKFQKNSEVLKFVYASPFAELVKAI
ncbi:uncharacterized protein LOC125474467 [Pyrus x bretschneideri]|uniref:uncharacterized protein LOC125474467 n=1 Tax=Pyrus x bretschneideri TaxID=225117 RepID=UPI00202E8093|nr:uncharacterized protein LOC125474467 [Pyrus x bretschneideri]